MAWVSSAERDQDQPPNQLIADLAAKQHGVVAGGQLRAIGLSQSAIHRRAHSGILHILHRDVFAVGHPHLTERARFLAAVLACGEGALLSHPSAAHLWGLGHFPGIEEVTVSRSTAGPRTTIVHTSRTIDRAQRFVLDAIPVTSVNRTLVDLADVVNSARVLAKAVHEADFLGKLDIGEIYPLLNGRRGAKRLKLALAGHRPADLKSDNEFDAFRAIIDSDLPTPQTNVIVQTPQGAYIVDLHWPKQRLVVEIDGGGHGTTRAREVDPVRDSHLQLAGYRVVRFTKRRLRTETDVVIAEIWAHLGWLSDIGSGTGP